MRLFQDNLCALDKATHMGVVLNEELCSNLLAPASCPLHYTSCFVSETLAINTKHYHDYIAEVLIVMNIPTFPGTYASGNILM